MYLHTEEYNIALHIFFCPMYFEAGSHQHLMRLKDWLKPIYTHE
jgi:hypothetical protein